jgi:hypothetical protein
MRVHITIPLLLSGITDLSKIINNNNNNNTVHVEYKNKNDTSKNRCSCDNLKFVQKVPDKHTWRAQHQGTTNNSHIVHCTHTLESTDVKVQNVYRGK